MLKQRGKLYYTKVNLIWFTLLKGENILAKAEEWNPVLRVSGEVYSVLGYVLIFSLFK